MSRRSLPLLALLLLGAGGESTRYSTGTPAIAAAFAAKETCSCRFVMERTEAECDEWTRVSPDVARAKVDLTSKTVKSRALLFWTARAEWVDAETGCRLVP